MAKTPNILFILCDDHAAHAISAYGSVINETPNIDRIGKEGMRFERCFCTNSICEPSRAAMLTGTYNHVNKVTTIGAHLDNRQENAAKILQRSGYQTAIFGKWHLGEGPAHEPTGFDSWKVLIGQGEYWNPRFVENGVTNTHEGYATDLITDFTVDYIQKRDKSRPFFIKCHHKAPHRSWEPHPKYAHKYETDREIPVTFDDDYSNRSRAAVEAQMRVADHLFYKDIKCVPPEGKKANEWVPNPENLEGFHLVLEETGEKKTFKTREELKRFKYQRYIKDYLRCIDSIDESVGRLFKTLEDEGILDETLIIYTSDQGFFLGDHGWFDKRFMYEESLKMPYLVRFPKEVKAGSVCDEITTNVDIPATWLDMAGVPVPETFQGYSQRPLLQNTVPSNWQNSMYYRYWMHLAHHYVSAHYGVRTKDYKLIYYYGEGLGQPGALKESKAPEWELFDLKKDPHELKNVYGDPSYRKVVQDLKDELHRLQKKVGDEPMVEVG